MKASYFVYSILSIIASANRIQLARSPREAPKWPDGAQRCNLSPQASPPSATKYPPCPSKFRCLPRPKSVYDNLIENQTKDSQTSLNQQSSGEVDDGECSTPIWSNATQICGEGEPRPKCLESGLQCIIAPYNPLNTRFGRCVPKYADVGRSDTPGVMPCGGGKPGTDRPMMGLCPPGWGCPIPKGAKCVNPPPHCPSSCVRY
jgi:hypothetical protein